MGEARSEFVWSLEQSRRRKHFKRWATGVLLRYTILPSLLKGQSQLSSYLSRSCSSDGLYKSGSNYVEEKEDGWRCCKYPLRSRCGIDCAQISRCRRRIGGERTQARYHLGTLQNAPERPRHTFHCETRNDINFKATARQLPFHNAKHTMDMSGILSSVRTGPHLRLFIWRVFPQNGLSPVLDCSW